jgi:hypothetical protein
MHNELEERALEEMNKDDQLFASLCHIKILLLSRFLRLSRHI